jgi:hypothetical protein
MNSLRVELTPGNPYNSGAGVALLLSDGRRAQLGFNVEEYTRVRGAIDEDAAEFAFFTSVIYACDRVVKRDVPGGDRWTREFAVEIPVADPGKWSSSSDVCELMLEFLTGDIWHLDFVAAATPLISRELKRARRRFHKRRRMQGNAVALFSGGLDSLVGAIDWLEDNADGRLVLASTYDPQAEHARADQRRVLPHLDRQYPGMIQQYVARTGVLTEGWDTNFRSRSLAFIGNAVFGASFLGDDTPIIIPENGAIAVNYPLTPARRGSLSTRTVHPHFLDILGQLLGSLGLNYTLTNPYVLQTKGEMMQQCRNNALLKAAYPDSASCSKRGRKMYWENRQARQCGACVPCVFRRAALHRVGLGPERYGFDLSPGSAVQGMLTQPNRDLSSVVEFIERDDRDTVIWRTLRSTGFLPPDIKRDYVLLVKRLRLEVKSWARAIGLL